VSSYGNQGLLYQQSLAIAKGDLGGVTHVNKFGRNSNCDATATDIWDLGSQPIWLAPTAARVHAIVSSDDTDGKTGAPNSVGARTVRIYGLKTWDTAETSEDVTLDGTTSVNTANSYVIIHRMNVLTCGASGPNAGIIKATAASDNTITAQINAGEGQTQMAIYGVPSTQTAYMTQFYHSILKSGGGTKFMDVALLASTDIENQPTVFTTKHTASSASDGSSFVNHPYSPYSTFAGPVIIKIQVIASAADQDVSAGFDLILVDN
jgi:hypothetical protein